MITAIEHESRARTANGFTAFGITRGANLFDPQGFWVFHWHRPMSRRP